MNPVAGGDEPETFDAGSTHVLIDATGGNDTACAGDGKDLVCGGTGDDSVSPTPGPAAIRCGVATAAVPRST